jgi:hypothetical protein
MKKEVSDRIKEIKAGMKCPKNFNCIESGLEDLCHAKDFGIENYIDCLDENPSECSFVISFGDGYLCRCPLRVFIAKKMGK